MRTITFLTARRHVVASIALALAGALTGCASVPTPVGVADTIAKNPSLSTLSSLIGKAGLTDTLNSGGPFTVFAPSNEAFKAVPAKTLEDLAQHPDKLKDVLSYHVISGKFLAAGVKNSKAKSLQGSDLELSKAGDFITVESAAVTSADVAASNGVVHIIDTVLLPPKK